MNGVPTQLWGHHPYSLLVGALVLGTLACATPGRAPHSLPATSESVRSDGQPSGAEEDRFEAAEGSRPLADVLRRFPALGVRDYGGYVCVELKRAATPSGVGVTRCPRQVVVVVDGTVIAEPESYLHRVSWRSVEGVRFLPPAEATTRYGGLGRNGALLIATRDPGPR